MLKTELLLPRVATPSDTISCAVRVRNHRRCSDVFHSSRAGGPRPFGFGPFYFDAWNPSLKPVSRAKPFCRRGANTLLKCRAYRGSLSVCWRKREAATSMPRSCAFRILPIDSSTSPALDDQGEIQRYEREPETISTRSRYQFPMAPATFTGRPLPKPVH